MSAATMKNYRNKTSNEIETNNRKTILLVKTVFKPKKSRPTTRETRYQHPVYVATLVHCKIV